MSKTSIDPVTKKTAANIREKREYRNYTQEYIGFELEISQNAYSKIELGHTKLTVVRLLQIAEILEHEVFELLKNVSLEKSNSKDYGKCS